MKNNRGAISIAARWLAGTGLWLIASVAFAQPFDNEVPLRITPKGTISLEYPNEWIFNRLIALSQDGRYLIDASDTARNIRVWDWEKKEVVQRLLLNEDTPERSDGKPHNGVLKLSVGVNLELTPDGRMVATCVQISPKQRPQPENYAMARVWNLESGEVVADIHGMLRNVPGLDREAVLHMGCGSISFSQDGKYMAVLGNIASLYANEADFIARAANYKTGKRPTNISGIALYETRNWQLLRFIAVPYEKSKQDVNKQELNSRVLFSSDSKQVSGVVFERLLGAQGADDGWVANRIVRWDVETGAQLEEKNLPKLGRPRAGVWWHWLPGGREVWWQNGFSRPPAVNDERTFYQTEGAIEQCRLSPAPAPTFESDVISNCAYIWTLTVLNLDTGKLRYFAPVNKNTPSQLKNELNQYSAAISPDGVHIVLFGMRLNAMNLFSASSSVEILSRETLQLEGRYSADTKFVMKPVFSGDSRYFAFPTLASRDSVKSALVFELPKKK